MTRAYFTSATCAISLLYLLNTLVFLQMFSNNINNNIILDDSSKVNDKINTTPVSLGKRGSLELIVYNKEIKRDFYLKRGIVSRNERDSLIITPYQKSIMIGSLLSDGWVLRKKGWNSAFGLKQSIKNFEYLWFVFLQLSPLCSNIPILCKNMKRGKLFYSVQFITRRMKNFKEIENLFFFDLNRNYKHINPDIYNYFDYVVLAHWIMGDGAKRNKNGLILCTDNFDIKDIILLMNILNIKYNIQSTLHKDNGKYRIYINKKNLLKFKYDIYPHFVPSFYYKIN